MYLQDRSVEGSAVPSSRVLILGEVLWDVFETSTQLGGAPLNFAVQAKRLGHEPLLISAVGEDMLGVQALQTISRLGLDTTHLQTSKRFETGTAQVHLEPDGQTTFEIHRPAAYDAVSLSAGQVRQIATWHPAWFYYGTLFPSAVHGRTLLQHLLNALPETRRFYDLNLRPGFESASLVQELLALAQAVKMNEQEMKAVCELGNLPSKIEEFCRSGSKRYGWEAVCVTLGERGCAMLAHGEYVEADALAVQVADTVGAGDAFAAAYLHGLNSGWRARDIAPFANRVGAIVASRPGAIPEWSLAEIAELQTARSDT